MDDLYPVSPLTYDAVVDHDRDGLAQGDGRFRAVGDRVNPGTGWQSPFPWTGYGATMGAALMDLERRLRERYGERPQPRTIVYAAAARARGGDHDARE